MSSPLILSSPSGVAVVTAASSGVPSLVVLPGAVQMGGDRAGSPAVEAAAVSLSGADVAASLDAAPTLPGADPAVPVLPRHVRDGSLGLERLQTVPLEKGGTGQTRFEEGHALFFAAGEGFPAKVGALVADPRLSWDGAKKELVVGGRLAVGGLEIAASAARGLE